MSKKILKTVNCPMLNPIGLHRPTLKRQATVLFLDDYPPMVQCLFLSDDGKTCTELCEDKQICPYTRIPETHKKYFKDTEI